MKDIFILVDDFSYVWGDDDPVNPTLNYNDSLSKCFINYVSNVDIDGNILNSSGVAIKYNNGSETLPIRAVFVDSFGNNRTDLDVATSVNQEFVDFNACNSGLFTERGSTRLSIQDVSGDYMPYANVIDDKLVFFPVCLDEVSVGGVYFRLIINYYAHDNSSVFDYCYVSAKYSLFRRSGNNNGSSAIVGIGKISKNGVISSPSGFLFHTLKVKSNISSGNIRVLSTSRFNVPYATYPGSSSSTSLNLPIGYEAVLYLNNFTLVAGRKDENGVYEKADELTLSQNEIGSTHLFIPMLFLSNDNNNLSSTNRCLSVTDFKWT